MTEGRPPPEPSADRRTAVPRSEQGVAARLATFQDRVRRSSVVVAILEVVAEYDRAGGGLLAAGLAYEALFALLPALLLAVGVVGLLLDPELATAIASAVGIVAPPLEPLAVAALDEVRRGALAFSVAGVLGLAWGASRLYRALDAAIGRIFHAAPRRRAVARAVRGLLAVLVGLGVVVGLAVLVGLAAALEAALLPEPPAATGPLLLLLPTAIAGLGLCLLAAAVYRWVPTRHVPWSALFPPAVGAGFGIAVFSQLFAVLAPRLIGVGVLVGSSVGLLAALVWLGVFFQILLLGAAWTRRRVLHAAGAGIGDGSDEGAAAGR